MATKAMLLRPYVLVAATRLCLLPISLSSRPRIVSAARIGCVPKRLQLGNGYLTKSRGVLVGGNGLRFSSSATNVNNPGSIDSPLMESMQKKIKEELSAESVSVKDAYGDGRHVSIDVISSAFEGQSAVNRQRMVYKAIWEELQNTVHAVDQMTTRTPSEAGIEK